MIQRLSAPGKKAYEKFYTVIFRGKCTVIFVFFFFLKKNMKMKSKCIFESCKFPHLCVNKTLFFIYIHTTINFINLRERIKKDKE